MRIYTTVMHNFPYVVEPFKHTLFSISVAAMFSFVSCSNNLRIGKGKWYIHKNPDGGHFMNTESTVLYYHRLLSDAYDERRERLNLHGRKGMLIADAFSGNFSGKTGFWTACRDLGLGKI